MAIGENQSGHASSADVPAAAAARRRGAGAEANCTRGRTKFQLLSRANDRAARRDIIGSNGTDVTARRAVALSFTSFRLGATSPREVEPRSGESADIQLPNGKSQTDEILKAEREENLKDAAKLADLADELNEALEKEDRFVFSLNTVKKTEEIERLARKIRARMRHE